MSESVSARTPIPASPDSSGLAAPRLKDLREQWLLAWPQALEQWSRFTKLREPLWCNTPSEEKREGLTGSFAMIRLTDHLVVISLRQIAESGLGLFAKEILAHEIGHHVFCPSDLNAHAQMLAKVRAGLGPKKSFAGMVANLYSDLLINNRLQRQQGLNMLGVYQKLITETKDPAWQIYLRLYEILWGTPRGTLVKEKISSAMEGDAQLGVRIVRVFGQNWMDGAGRFAALLAPHLPENEKTWRTLLKGWLDTQSSGSGDQLPTGLTEMDEDEVNGIPHPSLDPMLTGDSEDESSADSPDGEGDSVSKKPSNPSSGGGRGQCRQPFEYREILAELGIELSESEAAIRYYRELAIPHLIPFPSRLQPTVTDPLPEGLTTWDIGQPLEEIDWQSSAMQSPVLIPGFTTVQRVMGTSDGNSPERVPVDLDLYVDCSGSMPNPRQALSYLTLAGAIICISALRAGARVQATLWSGKREFLTSEGFVRDEHRILEILTGYFGGGTAFPIHILRETFKERQPRDRSVHVMVISDEGVDTMFEHDEEKNSGWDIARMALEKGKAGGSLVLNLYQEWTNYAFLKKAAEQGWLVSRLRDWEALVAFAREFSRRTYGPKS